LEDDFFRNIHCRFAVPSAVELLNYWTIRKVLSPLRIFSQTRIFRGIISVRYNLIIAGRVSEAAMGREGGAQRLDLPVYKHKKTGARSTRAHSIHGRAPRPKPTSILYKYFPPQASNLFAKSVFHCYHPKETNICRSRSRGSANPAS
jgi:hypothetical protein